MLSSVRPLKYGDKQGITEKENIKYICVTTGDSVIYNYHLNIPLCSLCVVYEVKVLGALNTAYSPIADQIICVVHSKKPYLMAKIHFYCDMFVATKPIGFIPKLIYH